MTAGCTEEGNGTRREVVVDGHRVVVVERGGGEPCVLLHGYPQSHWCWRHLVAPLAETHRVLAPDWLGWGDSSRAPGAAAPFESETTRLARLLDALGLTRVKLIAHDYGGFIALGFAARHSERLRRLAILNTRAHATFPCAPFLQFGLLATLARLPGGRAVYRRLPLGALHRRALRRYCANGSWAAADLERYVRALDDTAGRLCLAEFYAHYRLRARPALLVGAAALRVPAAVIWGDADPYCPWPIAEALAAAMPGAVLTRVRGADHYVMEERPAEVLAALRALLARAVADPPAG